MLYLTLLELNPRCRQVMSECSNPYEMHRTLSKAFDEGHEEQQKARCLFRVEETESSKRVLVQSRIEPEWAKLTAPKEYLLRPPDVREFSPRFVIGQRLAFRLRANPTKRLGNSATTNVGKRVPLLKEEDRRDWLLRKAAAEGFSVIAVSVNAENNVTCDKSGRTAVFGSARFDGVLQVTDVDLFLAALEGGVGTGKGFGFGLLSLARASSVG